jgi:hypothetical protein
MGHLLLAIGQESPVQTAHLGDGDDLHRAGPALPDLLLDRIPGPVIGLGPCQVSEPASPVSPPRDEQGLEAPRERSHPIEPPSIRVRASTNRPLRPRTPA